MNISVFTHNLIRKGQKIKILADKLPCGEEAKGHFDLTGVAILCYMIFCL